MELVRIPARSWNSVRTQPGSSDVTWTPVLTADSYSLYRDGVKIGDFTEIGNLETDVTPGSTNSYTVVAHKDGESSPHSVPSAVTSSTYELDASVNKLRGNQNELTIRLVEADPSGTEEAFEETFLIRNNAAGTYTVGDYRVYVDTKGNTQIRELYVVTP